MNKLDSKESQATLRLWQKQEYQQMCILVHAKDNFFNGTTFHMNTQLQSKWTGDSKYITPINERKILASCDNYRRAATVHPKKLLILRSQWE